MPKERFKLVCAVYLIFKNDNGQILLLQRANTNYFDGFYSLVAGHLDGQESAKNAAIREGREESGVEIIEQDLEFVHLMHRLSTDDERIDIFFEVKNWQGQIVNKEPHKCSDLSWFSPENLPEKTVPEVKFALEKIKK